MTIIVGILCHDGVVIASDGMASSNLGQTNFVGIDNLKTEIINEKLIVACAGDDGIMTLFINYLEQHYTALIQNTTKDSFAFAIGTGFSQYYNQLYINPMMQGALIVGNQYILDPIKAQQIEVFKKKINEFSAILAFELNGQHCMYSMQGSCPSMIRDGGIWYNIIGSGLLVGLPSIHLIKNILKINEKPEVAKAIHLAYWTVNHAIEVSSGGIGGEITITKLAKLDNEYKIEKVDTTGTEDYINSMYEHIHMFAEDIIQNSEKAPELS